MESPGFTRKIDPAVSATTSGSLVTKDKYQAAVAPFFESRSFAVDTDYAWEGGPTGKRFGIVFTGAKGLARRKVSHHIGNPRHTDGRWE
eukprot:482304-Pyramimonas_sp.AAC.1